MLLKATKPALIAAPPAAAAAIAVARWALQGSGNLYTDLSKQRYVPDPDFGWRLTDSGPIWLGLDLVAVLVATAAGLAVLSLLVRRREHRRDQQWNLARRVLWTASLVSLLVPAVAFASGFGPSDARDQLPDGLVSVPMGGVSGALEAPSGTYRVLRHEGTAVVASLRAGGEPFEARFTAVDGTFQVDPSDFRQPMRADIAARALSVDTGIDLRSKHAREELKVETHPAVRFTLSNVLAAEQRGRSVAFSAEGTVELIGRSHQVSVSGSIEAADPEARKRLGTKGPTLVVRAILAIDIAKTAIGNDGTFDQDEIPISVSLILVNTPKEPQQ